MRAEQLKDQNESRQEFPRKLAEVIPLPDVEVDLSSSSPNAEPEPTREEVIEMWTNGMDYS